MAVSDPHPTSYINDPELTAKVNAAIDSLRPFLEADQGDIQLIGIDKDYVARVQLLGACKTCTISNLTLKAGVEDAVRRMAPEIKAVEAVD